MHFRSDEVGTFTRIFDEVKSNIRNFPGCSHLKLMRDHQDPDIFYTYSKWESQQHLDSYRHSELFEDTWRKTKALFADKPMAFSLDEFGEEVV